MASRKRRRQRSFNDTGAMSEALHDAVEHAKRGHCRQAFGALKMAHVFAGQAMLSGAGVEVVMDQIEAQIFGRYCEMKPKRLPR